MIFSSTSTPPNRARCGFGCDASIFIHTHMHMYVYDCACIYMLALTVYNHTHTHTQNTHTHIYIHIYIYIYIYIYKYIYIYIYIYICILGEDGYTLMDLCIYIAREREGQRKEITQAYRITLSETSTPESSPLCMRLPREHIYTHMYVCVCMYIYARVNRL